MRTIANPGLLTAPDGVREISFRYELLDTNNVVIGDIDDVVMSCEIDYQRFAEIHRTARLMMRDDPEIDFLSDRIKPYIRLVDPAQPDTFEEWPMGVLLMATTGPFTDDHGVVLRDVQGYDQMLVLEQDKVADRFTIDDGAVYTDEIETILANTDGVVSWNIAPSVLMLPVAKDWEPGTSKRRIINDLLAAINYEALFFDEQGVAIGRPYVNPSDRASEYTYADNQTSIMSDALNRTIDLFSVPNQWTLVVSDPDRPPVVSTYLNDDPASPTSTVARGRTITDFRVAQDAADQATLDLKVLALAVEASQVYEHVEFATALNPLHSHSDVYTVNFSDLGIAAKFSESSWSMHFAPGALMHHRARRSVAL